MLTKYLVAPLANSGVNTSTLVRNIACDVAASFLNKNAPNCVILGSWVLENSMLADKPFAKVLQSLETCILFNNNLYGKLVSLLEHWIHSIKVLKLLKCHFLFLFLTY